MFPSPGKEKECKEVTAFYLVLWSWTSLRIETALQDLPPAAAIYTNPNPNNSIPPRQTTQYQKLRKKTLKLSNNGFWFAYREWNEIQQIVKRPFLPKNLVFHISFHRFPYKQDIKCRLKIEDKVLIPVDSSAFFGLDFIFKVCSQFNQ